MRYSGVFHCPNPVFTLVPVACLPLTSRGQAPNAERFDCTCTSWCQNCRSDEQMARICIPYACKLLFQGAFSSSETLSTYGLHRTSKYERDAEAQAGGHVSPHPSAGPTCAATAASPGHEKSRTRNFRRSWASKQRIRLLLIMGPAWPTAGPPRSSSQVSDVQIRAHQVGDTRPPSFGAYSS